MADVDPELVGHLEAYQKALSPITLLSHISNLTYEHDHHDHAPANMEQTKALNALEASASSLVTHHHSLHVLTGHLSSHSWPLPKLPPPPAQPPT